MMCVFSFHHTVCVLDMEYMIARIPALVAFCVVMLGMISSCKSRKPERVLPPDSAMPRLVTRPYTVRGKRYVPMNALQALDYKAEGIASHYDASGTRGSLGEILRAGTNYAAHTTLPMPCKVRITNLSNGRTCEARISDRGPFSHNRLIDVSRTAAAQLGFLGKGLQRVRVEVISVGDGPNQLKAEE